MSQKIVVNECFGGFVLSAEAERILRDVEPDVDPDDWQDKRDHPALVRVVELLGDKASDRFSNLRIAEIPEGVSWHIDDYDGQETVHEDHRVWTSRGERS